MSDRFIDDTINGIMNNPELCNLLNIACHGCGGILCDTRDFLSREQMKHLIRKIDKCEHCERHISRVRIHVNKKKGTLKPSIKIGSITITLSDGYVANVIKKISMEDREYLGMHKAFWEYDSKDAKDAKNSKDAKCNINTQRKDLCL